MGISEGKIKMENQNKCGARAYLFIGKAILVFLSGGIVFHLIVMFIDYYLMIKPFYLNIRENFYGSIFSEPMIPMMVTYGLLSFGIFLLWNKAKNAALMVREKELHQEKAEAVLKSLQRFTGILAEHITSQNSEIVSWIESRKRSGHPVPEKVENPSQQISKAIQSMSELTFIVPYTVNRPNNAREFEKILFDKLYGITDATLEKNPIRAQNNGQGIGE
jgi:hypothetical protein